MVYDSAGPGRMMWNSVAKVPHPGRHEVLVKVASSSVNPADWKIAEHHSMFMSQKGKTVGQDVAGTVVSVGKNVTSLHNGDHVYGFGPGFAQYAICREDQVCRIPPVRKQPETQSPSMGEAGGAGIAGSCAEDAFGALPLVAVTAYQLLRKNWLDRPVVNVRTMLVIGAAGGVGCSVVQLARALGGPEMRIYAICATKDMDFCKEIGASESIDYTQRGFDFIRSIPLHSLDLIVDVVSGTPGSFDYVHSGGMALLKQSGKYVALNSSSTMDHFRASLSRMTGLNFQKSRYDLHLTKKAHSVEDLEAVCRLVTQGKFKVIIADRIPLTETNIRRAIHTLKQGRVRGKLLVKPEHLGEAGVTSPTISGPGGGPPAQQQTGTMDPPFGQQ
jgi:NADPH:quinone reductase-like Zn-dependent oxidoreductase